MEELDLLESIFREQKQGAGGAGEVMTLGLGDDMGGIAFGGEELLVTVDQVVEGVHFVLEQAGPRRVGWKAMMRNLSDVAAMGAVPVGAVVSLCLPRGMSKGDVLSLNGGIVAGGECFGCPVIGGDVSVWEGGLVVSVTVFAKAVAGRSRVGREGARRGDLICVTGELGGSMVEIDGRVKHLDFRARVDLGQALVKAGDLGVGSMIDLSDGLATDLGHLSVGMAGAEHGTGLTAAVAIERLPLGKACRLHAEQTGLASWVHGVLDGEDYELCFTIPRAHGEMLPSVIHGVGVCVIGEMLAYDGENAVVFQDADGRRCDLGGRGWEHGGTG